MNRLMRSLVAGGIIGAAVGVSMLMMQKKSGQQSGKMLRPVGRANEQTQNGARNAAKMVRDNTMRWTSAMRDGTEALSKRLTRRLT